MSTLFGIFFVGASFPIADTSFTRVDPTHWVLDIGAAVTPDHTSLKEVALFLTQPQILPPDSAMGLYIAVGNGWQWRGYVSNSHPSEVLPLQWPEIPGGSIASGQAIQLGVSVEPLAEVLQREGTKLASRQEFAKRVALDLFRYMESFNKGTSGDMLVLPISCLEQWFQKFDEKFRRNPEFLMTSGEKIPGT